MANKLDFPRKKIDAIDRSILALLVKRIVLSRKIGEIKRKEGAAVLDPKRETQVRRNVRGRAKTLGLSGEYANSIFSLILSNSRKNQR